MLHLLDNPDQEVIPTATVERAGLLIREFLLPQARDFFGNLSGSAQQRLRDAAGWILMRPDLNGKSFRYTVRLLAILLAVAGHPRKNAHTSGPARLVAFRRPESLSGVGTPNAEAWGVAQNATS